jgi:hypothetical protein
MERAMSARARTTPSVNNSACFGALLIARRDPTCLLRTNPQQPSECLVLHHLPNQAFSIIIFNQVLLEQRSMRKLTVNLTGD